MPRLRLTLLVAALTLLLAQSAAAATALYPDLQTLPPRDLKFDNTDVTGSGTFHNVLRFSNTTWNVGQGPLMIGGNVPPGTTSAPAIQTVVSDDGSKSTYTVGNYTIHPEHQHFHYDGWGEYELWTKTAYDNWLAAGRPSTTKPDLVGTKTTSCVLDEEFIRTLPSTPYPRRFTDSGCDPTKTGRIDSGLSIGWGDTYDFYRFEQWIDLGTRKLADGTYVLRSVADPDNKLYESTGKSDSTRESQSANEATTTFRVSGGVLVDSDRPSGTVTINDVAKATTSTNVTVKVLGRDDVSGVDSVRISNDGVSWKQYTYGGSGSSPMSIAWDLSDTRYGGTTTSGQHTVYAQFHDASGKWSASETDTIDFTTGTTPPPDGSNSAYRTAVLEAHPVGYWRLGETSGATAFEETSLTNGTYINAPGLGAASLLNSDTNASVRFGGSNYVRVTDSTRWVLGGAISLEAWIKPDALPATGQFASIVTRPEGYSLQFNGPRLEFTVIQSGTRRRLQAPAGAIATGGVYHVVGTYDGTAGQRLYINGVQVATSTLAGPASRGYGLYIGSWDDQIERFRGTVDEVAVYDSLLTGLQAKQHYDAGIATAVGVATPTGLTATAASSSQIDLRWTDASNNEAGFTIERSADSSFSSPTAITVGPNITSYSDTGRPGGTTYWYRVKATTNTDSSAWSNVASATTSTAGVAAPSALTATASSSSAIALQWTDNAANESGFEIQRSTDSAFTNPVTQSAATNATSLAVSGLTASTTYWFRVRAMSSTTSSAWSNVASATTQAASTPTPGGDYAGEVTTDAPVSYWRLGEASGATTAADSRALNRGTYYNGVTLGAAPLITSSNTAARLDGTNDHVRVADSSSLDFTSAFSVEAWIKPETLSPSWQSVVTKSEAYSIQFAGGLLEFTVIQSGVRQRLRAPSGTIATGTRYHVVGTYDGATMRLYVNGVQVASKAQTGPASVTSTPLELGSWDGGSEFFRGTVDEVAVYGNTLSATRVAAHWTAGK